MRDPLLEKQRTLFKDIERLGERVERHEISESVALDRAFDGFEMSLSEREKLARTTDILGSVNALHIGNSLGESKKRTKNSVQYAIKHFMSADMANKEFFLAMAQGFLTSFDIGDTLRSAYSDYPKRAIKMAHRLQRSAIKEALENLPRKKREELYERLSLGGAFKEFMNIADQENSLIPYSIASEARKWALNNSKIDPFSIPEQLKIEEAKTIIEVTPEPNVLTIVEVEELLPEGEGEDIGPLGMRERGEEGVDIRTQPRLDWVISALQEDGFDLKDMILYREKMVEGYDPERSGYRVLEVQKDHHHFQIAISETVGNATYVIRAPLDFQDDAVVTVADLKKMDTVFQTSCYTPKQWTRNVRKYAYTSLDELQVQLKTRIGWGDKKAAVEESFGLFYCETEQLPFVHDHTIIEFGPLAGKTTFARLYGALNKQSIPGLEHARNYKDLRDHIFGQENSTALVIEEKPIPAFCAQKVFKNAVMHIQETRNLPNIGEDFDRSLQAKKVSNLESIVIGNPDNITNSTAFLVATGVAIETGGGEIKPAPPVVISQFARFLGL